MKSELNDYKINNADGTTKGIVSELKDYSDNENPRYIKENILSEQKETTFVSETFVSPENGSFKDNKATPKRENGSSATSATSSSSATSAATSVSSAIGGSVGALAGTVAAAVMATVVVVAAFVSTLTINISLVLASMTSLVFQVDLKGAQEEDFANPIVAFLENDRGDCREQEININSLYITFNDLEPDTEYVITIRNDEKVFVKKSYFTAATESREKGYVNTYYEGDELFVSVENVQLNAGEFYTVTVKDEKGKVVFVKDDTESDFTFSFKYGEPQNFYVTLSVSGKVCSLSELEVLPEPEYDFDKPQWAWEEDFSSASVTFSEKHGGEPLILFAQITSDETEPTCEVDGFIEYTATVDFDGVNYSAKERTVIPAGHVYGTPVFEWTEDGNNGYTATATFVCVHDDSHIMTLPAEVSATANGYRAEVEYDGIVYSDEYSVISYGANLSLDDGAIYIDPTGYARSHNNSTLIGATSYVSSESGPYIISGTIDADESLDVYNMTGTKKTIYLRFNDVHIQSGMYTTAFRIIANADLDIYIVNEGSTTIKAGNHYGIEVQGDITVNIYVTGSESFSLSGDNGPFGVPPNRSGTCNLYMNGVKQ